MVEEFYLFFLMNHTILLCLLMEKYAVVSQELSISIKLSLYDILGNERVQCKYHSNFLSKQRAAFVLQGVRYFT